MGEKLGRAAFQSPVIESTRSCRPVNSIRQGDWNDLGLKGKLAVITGGSLGIGLAVAEGLAAEGVSLVLAARQPERLHAEAERIAKSFAVDVTPVVCILAYGLRARTRSLRPPRRQVERTF